MPTPAESHSARVQYDGRAAEDLAPNSVELKVIIKDLTPALTGGFAAATGKATVTTTNLQGTSEHATTTTSNVIIAHWGGDKNADYPPTVRKGEQVTVYKRSDADKYYWESAGRDPNLRQTEVWRMSVGGTTDNNAAKNDSNSYSIELNSIDKRITIRSSMANGEPVMWVMDFNTGAGIFTLADTKGNMFYIDSNGPQVQMANSDGAMVQLMKESVNITAPKDIVLKAGRQILANTPVMTMANEGGDGVTKMSVKALAIEASDGVTLKGATVGIEGAVKMPGAVVTGPLRAGGYSTGSPGGGYAAASTDVAGGSGERPANAPDDASPGGAMRHATAVEQFQEAMALIKSCFDQVEAKIGVPTGQSGLTGIGQTAKMPKNQGE